jgi:hypothetical protein
MYVISKKSTFILWVVVAAVVPAGSALADLWDIHAGIGPDYATTFRSYEKDGMGFHAYFDLGLTETLNLSAVGGYNAHFVGGGNEYSIADACLGLSYNLDILVVVPFAAVRLGWIGQQPNETNDLHGLGLSVGIGFDYLVTDYFTLGLAAEYLGMITSFDIIPAYVSFVGRIGFRLPY